MNKKSSISIFTLIIILSSCSYLFAQAESSLTDSRDGKIYKTVLIGDKTWMAENLNYEIEKGSFCYENNPENCLIYGRLYILDKAKSSACPEGWHIPDSTEWNEMLGFISQDKGAGNRKYDDWNDVGHFLKAKTGWENGGNGTDDYGFAALPGGSFYEPGNSFLSMGERAYFWTSTEKSFGSAFYRYIFNSYPNVYNGNAGTYTDAYSIRCVKD